MQSAQVPEGILAGGEAIKWHQNQVSRLVGDIRECVHDVLPRSRWGIADGHPDPLLSFPDVVEGLRGHGLLRVQIVHLQPFSS